jgi:hypothetical protein
MLLAFITLAAEEAEPSKTAFYVGGGLLVAWALILAGIGMSRPAFPGNRGAMRGVIAISVGLVAIAMATAIITG